MKFKFEIKSENENCTDFKVNNKQKKYQLYKFQMKYLVRYIFVLIFFSFNLASANQKKDLNVILY